MTVKMSKSAMRKLYNDAHAAGRAAAVAKTPTPMIVGSPTTLFGNDIDTTKPVHYVASGVCGYAWVNVKPGHGRFARWLKYHGYARSDGYYGGVSVTPPYDAVGQSYEKMVAYADAFAKVLTDAGISATVGDRLD